MTGPNAQTKMKALVTSRLLLGDFNDWREFEREREVAEKITNRHTARSVASQIGRSYSDLSAGTREFVAKHFVRCDYDDLARLCEAIEPGRGLYLRLDEFENAFFPLAEHVKRRFPFYAHVSITTYGLQFEYPEHHFLNDLDAAFEDLKETRQKMAALGVTDANMKSKRDDIALLLRRSKFVSRSMVSASFSLVEAFLSGLFFTALNVNALGTLPCDESFLNYARKNESASLKDRIDRVVRFVSSGALDGQSEPFKPFIEIGKRYRDAIHHTTPFERKGLEAGQRLVALYEVRSELALLCALLSVASVLKISGLIYGGDDPTEIANCCKEHREKISAYSLEQGIATVS